MRELSRQQISSRIARNIAALIDSQAQRSFVLNLGVGIPTLVADYITNPNVYIHAENGMLGVGPLARPGEEHPQLINAGRQPVTETAGCVYMDSSLSFGIIRGGHVDATVLGAFEVDQDANISNWIIPGGKQLGVGGAMDLAAGARQTCVAMTHTNRGKPKLVSRCTLPVTSRGTVTWAVTELGMFRFEGGKVTLTAVAPDTTLEEIAALTGLVYGVVPDLKTMLP